MKKLNLWLLVSLFVAALTLSACGGSDDEPTSNNRLSGKWICTQPFESGGRAVYSLTFGTDNSCTLVKELWQSADQLHVRWIYEGKYIVTSDAEATVTLERILCQNPEDPEPGVASTRQKTFKVEYRIDGKQLYVIGLGSGIGDNIPEGPYIKQ